MSVASNDIFLATLDGSANGQRIMLTATYRIVSITSPPFDEKSVSEDMAARLGAGGADVLETAYLNCMPSNYTLNKISVQKIWPVRYRRYEEVSGNAGNIANVALSSNVATVLSFHSEMAGRSQVANKHIGPLATAVGWYTGGELTAGYKAVLGALRNAMLLNVTAAGWYTAAPTIYHPGDVVPKWNDITNGQVLDTVRVMRRRTVGLGE